MACSTRSGPGLPFPYKDDALAAYLAAQSIPLLPQHQYFDGYRLTVNGVSTIDNQRIKQKLGFAGAQPFSAARMAATRAVARTVSGEDCDQ